jgi:hypothetical protein
VSGNAAWPLGDIYVAGPVYAHVLASLSRCAALRMRSVQWSRVIIRATPEALVLPLVL